MKNKINEHDMTKLMFDVIRGDVKKIVLKENEEELVVNNQTTYDNIENEEIQKETISPKPGDIVYDEELKKLTSQIDPSAQILNFKIYPYDRNAILEGNVLQGEETDSGITFEMNLKKRELTTTIKNVDLNDENVVIIIKKLTGFNKNWVDFWNEKMATEYKPKKD